MSREPRSLAEILDGFLEAADRYPPPRECDPKVFQFSQTGVEEQEGYLIVATEEQNRRLAELVR
jgi:hypothetical protein